VTSRDRARRKFWRKRRKGWQLYYWVLVWARIGQRIRQEKRIQWVWVKFSMLDGVFLALKHSNIGLPSSSRCQQNKALIYLSLSF
jgi:hypothetical protein